MKKNLCLSSLLIILLILSSGCNTKNDVVFVHLTDPHVNSPEREARLDSLLRDIEQLVPAPEFILVTGDQTERGYRSELQAYDSVMATSKLPVYNTPGNHELRWSPYGKNAVQEHWGNPFQSIDCGPAQLLLLDSSMLLEHYGHYSPHLLARVRRELQRLGPDRPLILASHHPVMFEQRYVDNELAVLDMLDDFSPVLYLTGHGHGFKHWSINNIDFFMTDGAMDPNPGYRLIRIENDSVHVYERDFNKQTLTRVLARLLHPVTRPSVSISSPVPKAVVSNTLELALTVPDSVTVSWRLSDAAWLPLENRAGQVLQTISLAPFPDGQHWLQIQLTQDSLNTWREQIPITISRENPAVAWRQKFDDETQAAGCVWQDRLFLPSNSGTLRCLNIHDGNLLQEIVLPGSIVTTPAIHADTLFVTTTAGVCAAISATSGAIFWQEKYVDAIFSAPAWYENRLYFGTSDNSVMGINSGDGKVSWKFTTGKHVKCRPACDAGTVVFGSWDGYFYGVDAVNGQLKWQQQISANPYFPAATSNPLIHDGTVFVSSHDHAVHAFAVESGQRLWKHEKTPNQFGGYSSPAWWRGNLVFGSLSGHVFLLNATTGKSVATIALNSAEDPIFDSSPLIANDRCFVGSVGGRLYDVNLKTPAVESRYQVGDGYIFASPVLMDNKIVTAAMSGETAAIIIN